MKNIPDKSVDMILCDLPYGTTDCSWDTIIPLDKLWEQYERITKDSSAIVLTASGQFVNKLIQSKITLYKYKWIWVKTRVGNFVNAKNKPMTNFEEVLVFSKGNTANGSKLKINYYPQGITECGIKQVKKNSRGNTIGQRINQIGKEYMSYTNYPKDVLFFDSDATRLHPTQKPVALFEYLIKTYTNEGEIVLDNCIGSGTTAIAAINTNRQFIGIEKEEKYFDIATEIIEKLKQTLFTKLNDFR